MIAAGIGLIILGYAFAYSGISNLTSGGKGWGLLQSVTGKGTNTNISLSNFIGDIKPLGNSGAPAPASAPSPVSGVQQV
jgi:hypothetical protein